MLTLCAAILNRPHPKRAIRPLTAVLIGTTIYAGTSEVQRTSSPSVVSVYPLASSPGAQSGRGAAFRAADLGGVTGGVKPACTRPQLVLGEPGALDAQMENPDGQCGKGGVQQRGQLSGCHVRAH